VQLPEDKGLFGSFSSEKGQILLFLKKKKQKEFYLPAASRGAGLL
jgi:hypothetical protein